MLDLSMIHEILVAVTLAAMRIVTPKALSLDCSMNT